MPIIIGVSVGFNGYKPNPLINDFVTVKNLSCRKIGPNSTQTPEIQILFSG